MLNKLKNKLLLFFIVFFMFSMYPAEAHAEIESKKILVIGSYSVSNEWEQDILIGFHKILSSSNDITVEYLDSNKSSTPDYYDVFLNLLNLKYEHNKIDCMLLMDDEAVRFARTYLFDPNAFCYKIPMFFVGVNELPAFSDDELKYISGMLDVENSLDSVEIMLNTNPNIKTIYLLTDESMYCRSMEENIIHMPLYDNEVNIEIVRITDIDNLKNTLKNLDKKNSGILLSGTYSTVSSNSKVPSKDVIDYIKSITDIPIYTTLYSYVEAGAIGGIVNDGSKVGEMGANFLSKVMSGEAANHPHFFTPPKGFVDNSVFNYKSIREYNINPLDCPPNSIYLEKPKFIIPLPISYVYTIYGTAAFALALIIILSILSIKNKKIAEKERIKLIEAKQREAIKTDYIIIMSHEFRTPLNVIKSVTDLLIMKLKKGNIDKEYMLEKFNVIIKNSDRLNRTINHSIDVSKLESGMMSTSFKMYNIVHVVEEITDSMIDFARANNVDVIFDTTEEEIYMAIDRKSMDRIILNILSNAVKSIENRGKIYVKCSRDNDSVFISVKDNGVGISTEAVNHIFEKFYQIVNSYSTRNFEGNGLGLYIVKKLVELHNGDIKIESQIGVGTTFTLIFPITVVDEYPPSNDSDDIDYLARLEFSDID